MITSVTYWQESAGFPILTSMALLPVMGMLTVWRMPSVMWAGRLGLGVTTLNVLLNIVLLIFFQQEKSGIQFAEQISFAGLSYSAGIDGISILFLSLTSITAWLVTIYISATRNASDSRYLAHVLAYQAIITAAFCALNLLQFWVISALELIPVILLISQTRWNQKKRFLAIRLFQFFGSSLLMTLGGFLLLAFGLVDSEHELTFDLLTLESNNAYLHDETLIFILLFYGFAIRMPLFPFHSWLPLLAEQQSLTSLTIFIVGLKLGIYGVIRFILPLVPGVAEQWADFVIVLCLISIFYGALLAYMQNNIYRLLAFAVVSHTGGLLFGVFSFNKEGLEGTLLLCLVYGLAMAGKYISSSLVHEETGTAMIPRLGDLFDSHVTLGLLFLITALSTMIMPGSLGFDAGHLLLEGVVEEHEWLIATTILFGNVLAAGFLLWAFQRMFLANSKRFKKYNHSGRSVIQERIITLVICGIHLITGLNSFHLVNLINPDTAELVASYPMHSASEEALEPAESNVEQQSLDPGDEADQGKAK